MPPISEQTVPVIPEQTMPPISEQTVPLFNADFFAMKVFFFRLGYRI
jgi:hypothetical protein